MTERVRTRACGQIMWAEHHVTGRFAGRNGVAANVWCYAANVRPVMSLRSWNKGQGAPLTVLVGWGLRSIHVLVAFSKLFQKTLLGVMCIGIGSLVGRQIAMCTDSTRRVIPYGILMGSPCINIVW